MMLRHDDVTPCAEALRSSATLSRHAAGAQATGRLAQIAVHDDGGRSSRTPPRGTIMEATR